MGARDSLIDKIPPKLLRFFAAPYISGQSAESAFETADDLYSKKGLYSTIDMLGESVSSEEDAAVCRDRYLAIADNISSREYCSISLKPSSMGLNQSFDLCLENIESVLRRAKEVGRDVTIDMEQFAAVDPSIELYRKLRPKYDNLGMVLQSRLYRTRDDVEEIGKIGGRIRICIGAYPESMEVAMSRKGKMKEAFFEYALRLIELGFYVELATHDGKLIHRVMAEIKKRGGTPDHFEIQWLLGVPVEPLRELYSSMNLKMRIYVPFCEEWINADNYLRRRLRKNPGILGYVLRNQITRWED